MSRTFVFCVSVATYTTIALIVGGDDAGNIAWVQSCTSGSVLACHWWVSK